MPLLTLERLSRGQIETTLVYKSCVTSGTISLLHTPTGRAAWISITYQRLIEFLSFTIKTNTAASKSSH